MKKIIAIIFVLAIIAVVYAYNNPSVDFKADNKEGIQFFKGTWQEALSKAKQENKLVFLDVYASWCGPCKKLKKRTFSNAKAAAYFNEHFVNVSLDGEVGEGITVAQMYFIQAYPSLFLLNSDGVIKGKAEGYLTPNELIGFAKTVQP